MLYYSYCSYSIITDIHDTPPWSGLKLNLNRLAVGPIRISSNDFSFYADNTSNTCNCWRHNITLSDHPMLHIIDPLRNPFTTHYQTTTDANVCSFSCADFLLTTVIVVLQSMYIMWSTASSSTWYNDIPVRSESTYHVQGISWGTLVLSIHWWMPYMPYYSWFMHKQSSPAFLQRHSEVIWWYFLPQTRNWDRLCLILPTNWCHIQIKFTWESHRKPPAMCNALFEDLFKILFDGSLVQCCRYSTNIQTPLGIQLFHDIFCLLLNFISRPTRSTVWSSSDCPSQENGRISSA